MDFRKQQREHPPIHINGKAVEKVESFKFLGVHITDKLKLSTHTDSVVKKAQQHLFNLRRLKKFGLSPKTLTNFYRCTIESILSGCITAWYGNCKQSSLRAPKRLGVALQLSQCCLLQTHNSGNTQATSQMASARLSRG